MDGELFALAGDALALNLDETATLLSTLVGDVNRDVADSLWRETGGRAAAVVLRAQALRSSGREPPANGSL